MLLFPLQRVMIEAENFYSSISLVLCEGNQLVTSRFPSQQPVMQNVFPCHDVINYFSISDNDGGVRPAVVA